MPYQVQTTRANPHLFVFLLDQSASMVKPIAGAGGESKAVGLVVCINRLLRDIVLRCTVGEGTRDYHNIAILGYGGSEGEDHVGSAFAGDLAGRRTVWISEIKDNPLRYSEKMVKEHDGDGYIIETPKRSYEWIDPVSDGRTPMCQAFHQSAEIISEYVEAYPKSYPPICINITDGMSTDGDPAEAAARIRSISSDDGMTLLFNIHLSTEEGKSVQFPGDPSEVPLGHATQLFEMSSVLPLTMRQVAQQRGYSTITDTSRGFAFNADIVALVEFLLVGTTPLVGKDTFSDR